MAENIALGEMTKDHQKENLDTAMIAEIVITDSEKTDHPVPKGREPTKGNPALETIGVSETKGLEMAVAPGRAVKDRTKGNLVLETIATREARGSGLIVQQDQMEKDLTKENAATAGRMVISLSGAEKEATTTGQITAGHPIVISGAGQMGTTDRATIMMKNR